MIVRRADGADLPSIATIYNHYVVHSVVTFDVDIVTIEDRRAWFEQFDAVHPLLVCEIDGEVVGYAYYLPFRAKPAYRATKECTVYVAPDRHARGVGKALYRALIDCAREHGVHALVGVLGGENAASAALHTSFGFELVGHLREVGHKLGGFVDTYYYEKLLETEA
jgi:L-amino acid N-acyltransferase YncA